MKVSVIISACDKRERLFERALDTWAAQTLPKDEWEMLIVDDANRESLRRICKSAAASMGIKMRFIRIDKSKSTIPVKTFIPVLTNNVGFRQADGEVVVITGPETLQAATNLEIAAEMATRDVCAYGCVYRASVSATRELASQWPTLKNAGAQAWLNIPGAQEQCVTLPPHPPAYWYFMAVAKRHVMAIGGVDERFLGGLCGEDDDFANRMGFSGIQPVFETRILGFHQDHSMEDMNDKVHINRKEGDGYHLWVHNVQIMIDNKKNGEAVMNKTHEWGSPNLITLDERY